jgi:myosin-crossreactive antigen
MNTKSKAYLVGGGIGSLSAAAFMIRDGNLGKTVFDETVEFNEKHMANPKR